MARLLIFNPEHDYALANGSFYYRAPKSIVNLAESLRFLPALLGKQGDVILTPDDRFFKICDGDLKELEENIDLQDFEAVLPWGWNAVLKYRLKKLKITEELLPTDEEITNIRRLSHRRLTIAFNEFMSAPEIPVEFFQEEKAMEFAIHNAGCYFKLPWSSGGRGVVDTKELNESQIQQWIRGSIKKQGSIMGEKAADRNIVFASLWETGNSQTTFKGYSISISDGRGKYKGNVLAPQDQIYEHLQQASRQRIKTIIERQKVFLNENIAPCYSGSLGIDMIIDTKGKILPCVEVNLRKTMGHMALCYSQLSLEARHLADKYCTLPFLTLTTGQQNVNT